MSGCTGWPLSPLARPETADVGRGYPHTIRPTARPHRPSGTLTYVRTIFLLLALLPALARADGPVWTPPAMYPPILRDVASRLQPTTDARDADLITYTHEATHFLSRWRPGYHGVYVLEGKRHFIPTPPLRTEAVLSSVPSERRGTIYDTYLRQARTEYWAAQPLMIIDEWNAYTHGCMARRQLSLASRRETDVHCRTFAGYAEVLYAAARDCNGYDITELRRYCRDNIERCRATVPELTWDFRFE